MPLRSNSPGLLSVPEGLASSYSQRCSPFSQSLSQLLQVLQAEACSLLPQHPWEEAAAVVVVAVAAAAISILVWRNQSMEKWFLPVREKSKLPDAEEKSLVTPCSPWAERGTAQRGWESRLQSMPSKISLLSSSWLCMLFLL